MLFYGRLPTKHYQMLLRIADVVEKKCHHSLLYTDVATGALLDVAPRIAKDNNICNHLRRHGSIVFPFRAKIISRDLAPTIDQRPEAWDDTCSYLVDALSREMDSAA